ncbi:MAG: helix-turn-helix domain-containing protein, partial [Bacteroidota bacterium]
QQILQQEQRHYWADQLVKTFDYSKIVSAMADFRELVPGKKLPDAQYAVALSHTLLNKAREQAVIAEKFQLQLQQLLQHVAETGNTSILEERVSKGIGYFVKAAGEELLLPLQKHISSLQHAAKVKKYVSEAAAIEGLLLQQVQKMIQAFYEDIVFCKNPDAYKEYTIRKDLPGIDKTTYKNTTVKGSSQAESLDLFKKGKSIPDIAAMRQLTEGTVTGHLAMFIRTGELDVLDLITEERLNIILPVVIEIGGNTVSPVKEVLGDEFSYTDIRIVLNHWQRLQQEKVNT